MTNQAFSIETSRYTAGIAVADGQGFRFFSAHPLFASLDGRHFSSVAAAEKAARRRENEARNGMRRQDSRGQVFRSWGFKPERAQA
ncbi:hypothetical protein [Niveispirillum fermenti]|uniref:hypothetical protein n=1 Tax=Niveispirillum fermenti TaxID=1233113 RepID=UPI003A88053D